MSHEPECMMPVYIKSNDCWVCRRLKAAYQRGQRDAKTPDGEQE